MNNPIEDLKHQLSVITNGEFQERRSRKSDNGGDDGMDDLSPRVAVLEQIATSTKEMLTRIETRIDKIDERHERDFRVLFGAIITATLGIGGLLLGLLGVVAHGFKWM